MARRIRFTPLAAAGAFVGMLAGAGSARAANVPFVAQPPISSSADGPRTAFAADVDGDGDLDILTASGYDDTVAWYENAAGNGSSWTPHVISTSGDAVAAVAGADIDGDGDVDVLAAAQLDGEVAWYENTSGNGSTWTAHAIGTGPGALVVATADVDGDGDVDAVVASVGDNRLAWFENTAGNGSTWTTHTITTNVAFPGSMVVADVDGDGDIDVLSASAFDLKVAWHENVAGDGSVWVQRVISTSANFASAVAAADIDGDGDTDVVAGYNPSLVWYENTAGNGSAWTQRSVVGGSVSSVSAADVDGDGDADILLTSNNYVSWVENTSGDGSAWTLRAVGAAGGFSFSVLAADVDGDGDQDVVSPSYSNDRVAWYRNETIHATACMVARSPISTLAHAAYAVGAGDVDGDGDQDVVSASFFDDKLAWYENLAGGGSAWATHTVTTLLDRAAAVAVADVDDDGDQDLLSASSFPGGVRWYENVLGNGSTWTERTIGTSPGARSLFAADIDGDGDLDAVSTTGYTGFSALWYENTTGNGSAWTTHTIATFADTAGAVFPVDVDRDGDDDVVSAGGGFDGRILWHENTAGNGSAWTTHTIATDTITVTAVPVADVDADGDPDVFAVDLIDGRVAWYENTSGNGSTWVRHTVSDTAPGAVSLVADDVDHDGDTDVVAALQGAQTVTWYENTAGNGSAWTTHTVAEDALGARAVATADVDGDGDRDLLSASGNDNKIAWYENSAGQFLLDVTDQVPPDVGNGDLAPVLGIKVTHGGRAGDSDLELARLGLLFEESPGDPLTSAEANALVDELRIYRDVNGNGSFDPGTDALVTTVGTLALVGGVQVVSFADGDVNVQVAFGAPRTYFVVAQITADASTQIPNQFRVTHLGLGPAASAAEDRSADIPLSLACPADVSSSIVGRILPVELQGFTVE